MDKWSALDALNDAAGDYDLSHRSLNVLRALLSFYRDRTIPARMGDAVVFPSNRTLSQRLNGMPESTLRRHLARLVASGIVSRRDSANRKRFARRIGQGEQIAFGFDLAPLALQFGEITIRAEAARQTRDRLAAMRQELAHLRARLLERDPDAPLCEAARKVLRRTPDGDEITALCVAIRSALAPVDTPRESDQVTAQMSGSDARNERHIQTSSKIYPEGPDIGPSDLHKKNQTDQGDGLQEILETCSEYKCYFPDGLRDWRDVLETAYRLTPMIGIDISVFQDAVRVMGQKLASLSVFGILEKLDRITNPGGYLRRLTQAAGQGGYGPDDLARFLTMEGTGKREIVS